MVDEYRKLHRKSQAREGEYFCINRCVLRPPPKFFKKSPKKICGIRKSDYLCNPKRERGAPGAPEGVRRKRKIIEKAEERQVQASTEKNAIESRALISLEELRMSGES